MAGGIPLFCRPRPVIRKRGTDGLRSGGPPGKALSLCSSVWGALTTGLISSSAMMLLTPGYGFMKRRLSRPLQALKNLGDWYVAHENFEGAVQAYRDLFLPEDRLK